MLDLSKNGAPGKPEQGITACEYIRIEVEEGSFKKVFKENDSTGITFPSTFCFDGYSILPTDDGVTIEWQKKTLRLELR